MSSSAYLEIIATGFGLIFVIGAIARKWWCWIPGIISSLLIMTQLWKSQLYAETILHLFYIIMGIYGLVNWYTNEDSDTGLQVRSTGTQQHVLAFSITLLLCLLAWQLLRRFTDNARPMIDAFTSVFSVLATWLEAKMYISCWIYWIVINIASYWLYTDRGLDVYAILYIIFLIASVVGWWQWSQSRAQSDQ